MTVSVALFNWLHSSSYKIGRKSRGESKLSGSQSLPDITFIGRFQIKRKSESEHAGEFAKVHVCVHH